MVLFMPILHLRLMPILHLSARVIKAQELMGVQTLWRGLAVQAFNECIIVHVAIGAVIPRNCRSR